MLMTGNNKNKDFEFQVQTHNNVNFLAGNISNQSTNQHGTQIINEGDPNSFQYCNPQGVNNHTSRLNGLQDIDCLKTKYCAHQQLITIQTHYIDRNGNSKAFEHPLPENEFFENLGYGYMERYTSNPNHTQFPQKDYIMLRIGQVDEVELLTENNSLQRNVLKFEVVNNTIKNTQALFWVPYFSSGGCNGAIMPTSGQGCRYSRTTTLNQNNGNISFDPFVRYDRSIISNGCGSINPTLSFSDVNSRFQFSDLYTPITSANYYNYTGASSEPTPSNVGNEIISYNNNYAYTNKITTGYGINILSFPQQTPTTDNFIPFDTQYGKFHILNAFNEVFPYNIRETIGDLESDSLLSTYFQESGVFIEKWVEDIPLLSTFKGDFDANTNYLAVDVVIFNNEFYECIVLEIPNQNIPFVPIPGSIEADGVWKKIKYIEETEDNFNLSLWTLLGFTWAQTHDQVYDEMNDLLTLSDLIKRKNYRNTLIINENGIIGNQKHYSVPITNNSDLLNPQFNNLLFENPHNFNMFLNNPSNDVNPLQILSQTTNFLAENLPIRSEDPFFCIVSSILNDGGVAENYYSQNAILSVVDVVEKSVNTSDFFTYSGNLIHEISRPYDIGEVVHQIRRANGRLLNTNQFSSVIYLATINITQGLNPQLYEYYENENKLLEEKKIEKEKLIEKIETDKKLNKKQEILKKILTMNEMVNEEYDLGLNIENII
jgi:hypothetical protein